MKQLTIVQIERITGWSYPTALKFATINGQQDDNGKWYVPESVIHAEIDSRAKEIERMRAELAAIPA